MGILHPFRDAKRRRLARTPLPPAWASIVSACLPDGRLSADADQCRLEGLIQVFLSEKHFEGCRGIVINDRIRLTIASFACLLILNLRHDYYAGLTTILVYPADFFYENETAPRDGISFVETHDAAGLSTRRGLIALSWADTLHGARHSHDGSNVVLHEFAHQLDLRQASPRLAGRAALRDWADVLNTAFLAHRRAVQREAPTSIDAYGATHREEFFAVVTEQFFESPHGLRQAHPALYNAFRLYYGQDPADRTKLPSIPGLTGLAFP